MVFEYGDTKTEFLGDASFPLIDPLSLSFKNRENLQLIADKLNDEVLEFALKAGDEDKLFGSVTSQMISDSLQEKGFNILKKEIIIVEPIKFLGEHTVMIGLHKDIDAKVKIMVSALPSD